MRPYNRASLVLGALVTVLPVCALAQETGRVIYQLAGLMNILVGLTLTVGILFFVGGILQYLSHLGMDERDDGLHHMTWGVTVLFTLALLIGVSQFIQQHVTMTIYALGALIVVGILWFILSEATKKEEKKPEKK